MRPQSAANAFERAPSTDDCPPHLIYYSRQALSPSGRELLSPPFASGSTLRSRWKSATGHYYLVPCLCYLRICRSALARRKDIWLSVRRSMCQPRFSGIPLVISWRLLSSRPVRASRMAAKTTTVTVTHPHHHIISKKKDEFFQR